MRIEDETGDFVCFVGNDGLFKEGREWQIGQGHLRGNAFYGTARGDPGEFVSGARRCGLGEQVAEALERVGDCVDGVPQEHGNSVAGLKAVYQRLLGRSAN